MMAKGESMTNQVEGKADTIALAVYVNHGWADVIAITRDLLGQKVIAWQDRTGTVGAIPATLATIRVTQYSE